MQLYCLKVPILNNIGKHEIYIPEAPYHGCALCDFLPTLVISKCLKEAEVQVLLR